MLPDDPISLIGTVAVAVGLAGLLVQLILFAYRTLRTPRVALVQAERRGTPRQALRFVATVELPDGTGKQLKAEGLDMHHNGAAMTVTEPLRPGSEVFVHVISQGLMGHAHVCYCTESGLARFRVGLEFRSGLMRSEIGSWNISRVRQTV